MRFVVRIFGTSVLQLLLFLPSVQAQPEEHADLRIELGAVGGFDFSEGVDGWRAGPQTHLGYGRIGVTGTFAFIREDLPLEWTGGAWQLYAMGVVRPFGSRSWLSLGYGLTIHRRWARWDFLGRTESIYSRTNTTDAATIGVAARFGRFRPFTDLYLAGLLGEGEVAWHVLFGLAIIVL